MAVFHVCAKLLFLWIDVNPAALSLVEWCKKGCTGKDAWVHCNFGITFEVNLRLGLSPSKPDRSAAQSAERFSWL